MGFFAFIVLTHPTYFSFTSNAKTIRSSSDSNGIVECIRDAGNKTILPVTTFNIFFSLTRVLIVDDFSTVKMSLNKKKSLMLRNPTFIRPWQYVLEPLYGYIHLSEKEYKNRSINYSVWNFAPKKNNTVSVDKLIKYFQNSKLNNYKMIAIRFNLIK